MASKRRIRRNACTSKRRHDNPDAAWAAAKALRKSGKDYKSARLVGGGVRLSAYRCKFCGGWHIGHSVSRRNG